MKILGQRRIDLNRRERAIQRDRIAAARRELGLQLRVMRLEAQLQTSAWRQRLDSRQHLAGMGLTDANGVEALQAGHAAQPGAGEEPGQQLLRPAPHLARHTRSEVETCGPNDDREAAGRADRFVDKFRTVRQHRLLAVVRRRPAGCFPVQEADPLSA
ncbi:hypothetical protein JMJ56_21165 [Belnapia sp. T18]|uniref:Uncharacterized protein n=1 Tax=Belnapia arida TaxID=2804533 RepID=A0ABS1UB94_9PROT|nr:hypothetical protein [Belnapia arida]MBL6080531.1 hypothetical protein [Belnapia arida]